MKVFAFVGMLASLVGACGDGRDGQGGPDGGVQGSPRVTVVTGQPPALIVYREEAATEWKTPASPSAGTFELEVAGPYRLIVVCGGSDRNVFVTQLARTLEDEHMIEQPCGPRGEFPLHVRGQMLQEGEVNFGGFGRGESAAPWDFDLPAASGTFDFVALFGSLTTGFDRIEIRRDLSVTADLNLGTIDVAKEPTQPLVPTQFTAANLGPSESLSADLLLQSGNTFSFIDVFTQPERAWQLNLVPGAALRSTDTQDVDLSASSLLSDQPMRVSRRSITRRVRDGSSTSVTLMELLGSTTFEATADRLVTTWASLPVFDQIEVSRESFASDFSRFVNHAFLLSRAFLTSTGGATATLDFTDVPGFLPEWRHDPTFAQQFALYALRGTAPDDTTSSGIIEDLPAPTPPGAEPPRVDPQRAMAQIDARRIQLERARRQQSSARR